MNRVSHGTTAFVSALVLTCLLVIVASALWDPAQQADVAIAADDAGRAPATATLSTR